MRNHESSLIIPVYNKWELTRKCLKSIAENTDLSKIQVIVVDNASSDATARGCPFLGKQLFGDSFTYIRNEANRNFAGACNQGAHAARGEFLIFLNNDTEVQAGWYEPLIGDFTTYPDIAATGPLLVYPQETPLGRTVQHLGIFISPAYTLGHLYEGIPAASPLARKRRFFQAITGACLVVRKSLFQEAGAFDEGFINGFEDVDLCARLGQKGYRMTVNPDALVIHHESQTHGRHAHEEENSRRLVGKSLLLLTPDWHLLTQNDGLFLDVTEWLTYCPMLPERTAARLDALAREAGLARIKELLVGYPFWQAGWERAIAHAPTPREQGGLFEMYLKLFHTPRTAAAAYDLGKQTGNAGLCSTSESILRSYADDTPETFLERARGSADWCRKLGLTEMLERHEAWIKNYENFTRVEYPRFAKNLLRIAEDTGLSLPPNDPRAYALWVFGRELPEQKLASRERAGGAFSLLMPVYAPKPAHLRAALDSVLAQTHHDWELCIADDASPGTETAAIIREYMEKDARIRAVFRERNGRIAAATNSALEMAAHPWAVLMDQDDLLTPDALAVMARAIEANQEGMLFYSDEDKINDAGSLFNPHFKNSAWDWELLSAQNFVCHLGVYRTDRLRAIGGFRPGFEGAQDHDMLLRYVTGLDGSRLVHVPHVLYHWRAHEGSTAGSINAKAYALDNARKAVQQWLDSTSPGARAEDAPVAQWVRVRYPAPAARPSASIICEIPSRDFDLAAHARALAKQAGWPHELIYTCAAEDRDFWEATLEGLQAAGLPVLLRAAGAPHAINAAADAASGEILGFVTPHAVATSQDWLEETVSALWRPGIGAVGGKTVLRAARAIAHAGYMADASGRMGPLFGLAGAEALVHFGWNWLPRTVDALDGLFLFTRAEDFRNAGGLDVSMGSWALQDYCLRLGQRGRRSVWWPFATLFVAGPPKSLMSRAPAAFAAHWDGRLRAFNKNLRIDGKGFSLCTA
ncbi:MULTISPECIES: glycosyltransferase [unclassified Desulfovibrio]|uniref:glycosyltransferase n=1 Tax=unclassified Desulfovibrio TaxID=2593640 RepID=UPI0013EDCDBF|nr:MULTISPECIES: glycosyltransferase [unclassified Desulfovibrio]